MPWVWQPRWERVWEEGAADEPDRINCKIFLRGGEVCECCRRGTDENLVMMPCAEVKPGPEQLEQDETAAAATTKVAEDKAAAKEAEEAAAAKAAEEEAAAKAAKPAHAIQFT